MSKKRRLGRGLGALIDEVGAEVSLPAAGQPASSERGFPDERCLRVQDIRSNRFQPRRAFSPESIAELADSIRAQGLIQPIVVNESAEGGFELISGERRLRAVKQLGWSEIPVVVRRVGDSELLEMTMVENLQREDLNPIEEAEGYRCLVEDFSFTQARVAERVGKDRVTVANSLRLLKLPAVIRKSVAEGGISAGHARALLGLTDPAMMIELARKAVERELSVRRLEKMVRDINTSAGDKKDKDQSDNDSHTTQVRDLEARLRNRLGTRVRIRDGRGGKGRIEIDFYSHEEFDRLLEILDVPTA